AVRTLAYVLDRVLRLLHPSMPFITETIALQLWQRAGKSDRAPSLVVSQWPKPGERDLPLEERVGAFIDVVRAIRNVRQEAGFADKAPKDVVQKERAKLKEREERVKLLEADGGSRA